VDDRPCATQASTGAAHLAQRFVHIPDAAWKPAMRRAAGKRHATVACIRLTPKRLGREGFRYVWVAEEG
jgi:hypothetical protein